MKNAIITLLVLLLIISVYYNYKNAGERKTLPGITKGGSTPLTIELGKDSIEVYFYDASLGGDSSAFNGYNTYASMTAPTGTCNNQQMDLMVCGKISVPGGVAVNPKDLFQNVLPGYHQIGLGMRVRRSPSSTNQSK